MTSAVRLKNITKQTESPIQITLSLLSLLYSLCSYIFLLKVVIKSLTITTIRCFLLTSCTPILFALHLYGEERSWCRYIRLITSPRRVGHPLSYNIQSPSALLHLPIIRQIAIFVPSNFRWQGHTLYWSGLCLRYSIVGKQ